MKKISRHLIPGMVALGAFGTLAGAANAALPDPQPFLTTDSGAQHGTPNWYVDTSRAGGTYSALYRFPVDVINAGAGPLEFVVKTPTTGDSFDRTGGILQNHDATSTDLGPGMSTATTSANGLGAFVWGVKNLISYSLTPPAGGAPIQASIAPTCWFDGTTYLATGCNGDSNGGGFVSGIAAASSDAIAIGSNPTSPSLNITNVAPGTGSVTATINAAVQDAAPGNNSTSVPLTVPGVTAAPVAATTTGTTAKAIALSATISAPEVLGRRLDAAGPPAPAAATGAKTFTIVANPAHGTLSGFNAATGAVTYTATAGFTGTDTFTYFAEDSRGLRSPNATVTVTVGAVGGGGGGGGGTTPPPPTQITLKLSPAYSVVHKGGKTFVKVSGKLPVSQAGRSVKIQRKAGRKVKTIATARIASTGRYSKLVRVTGAKVSVRVTIPASATARSATTAFKTLTLKR